MTNIPTKETFVSAYAGQAPWDIPGPQKPFVDLADRITGSILDAGCGTGENALFFASQGHQVTGIDFLEEPIRRAKQKGADRGLSANFLVMDALALQEFPQQFDSAIDFRTIPTSSPMKIGGAMSKGWRLVLRPGGHLFLACFSDEEPGTLGPRRVSQKELHEAFAKGWEVESIHATRFEIVSGLKDMTFSDGGPKAWFVVVRRKG